MLPLPLGDVGCVYHVHHPHLWGKTFLSTVVRRPGLLLVITMQPLVLVFGIQLAGLLEHPTFSVGVIGWLIGGAVNLTRAIEYAVQTGRARIASFERLFPLTGFRASESGIDCRILTIVAVNATFVLDRKSVV